ncbi:MAG: methyltransferase [Candidatus Marinimicrobia bacterium]|nr:methyltransferase [Candidatus Neomarinimicrobiota bacterium]MCH7762974.1 methyltransferase [Candidatus Neomarinimicrobiota bacterium]
MTKKIDSKAIGLDIGLLIGRFFMNTEDLHYGYWPDDKTATAQNFAEAQRRHSQLIIDHIPDGVKCILDVGSGSGNLAKKLLDLGYEVDCVLPSEFLAENIRKKLGDKGHVHVCGFEDLITEQQYDLILFSESFQYVKLGFSIDKVVEMLPDGGYLLICDFFKKNTPGKSPLGGGHKWTAFEKKIASVPLTKMTDIDITEETAPTNDLLDKFVTQVLGPIKSMTGEYLDSNYPKLLRFMKWKYEKRLKKINRVYFTGQQTGENFIKYKTYRLLLFKK